LQPGFALFSESSLKLLSVIFHQLCRKA